MEGEISLSLSFPRKRESSGSQHKTCHQRNRASGNTQKWLRHEINLFSRIKFCTLL